MQFILCCMPLNFKNMPKGKAKSRFDFTIDPKTNKSKGCKYLVDGSWCDLPKYKRCKDCLRCVDGSKACYVMT